MLDIIKTDYPQIFVNFQVIEHALHNSCTLNGGGKGGV